MKVLVTGGSGVVGEGVLLALLRAKHEVRLLSRDAERAAKEWPEGVEPFPADVTDPSSLRGAADGCDAVLHVTGIVEERPPDVTFARVNVGGTRNVVEEAERAGVRRFVYVSSLGAERGESDYHASKREAEVVVRASKLSYTIARIANVYGPGDSAISVFLTLFRALPAIPMVGDGDQKFQPVFYRDLGEALARACERDDLDGKVLEIAGDELTSMHDLARRFEGLTDRSPLRVPVPEFLASLGVSVAGGVGVDLPLNDAMLTMLREGNVVSAPDGNALTRALGVRATPLDEGLEELVNAIPEQLPTEGVGALECKHFWADIEGCETSAPALLDLFREHTNDVMPIDAKAEPHSPDRADYGATLTLNIPGRGNVQVRVVESTERRVTLATVAGHPLAGVVRFESDAREDGVVRFGVHTFTRAGSRYDYLALHTVGQFFQDQNWKTVVEKMVEYSGGEAPDGVEHSASTLEGDDEKDTERWIAELVSDYRKHWRAEQVRA